MASQTETLQEMAPIVDIVEHDDVQDEEKAFLLREDREREDSNQNGLSYKFWLSAAINTVSTIAIVFVNKAIFETESLRHAQVSFAAFHFAITAGLLYIMSSPALNIFQAKSVARVQIFPLALAMIFNVVLQNVALAYSSIQFYQVVRTLLTPCVALLNYLHSGATVSVRIALTLVPICIGVAVVSYFDAIPSEGQPARGTGPVGAIFAFSGVLASSIYTILIGKCHKRLECTSQQLLLNQAPLSVLLMLYIIPFSDDVTVWSATPMPVWALLIFSGVLACFLNLSQFVIIDEAGAVSSTIVGHFKSCCGILLGWIYSGKSFKDGSVFGILLAISGIISYGLVTHRQSRR